jgi:predicted RNA polymerase sigma factor
VQDALDDGDAAVAVSRRSENPEAWLFQVARNRALDRLRHGRMAIDKEPAIARESASEIASRPAPLLRHELPPLEDDQLGLLFLTCHPSLAPMRASRSRSSSLAVQRR